MLGSQFTLLVALASIALPSLVSARAIPLSRRRVVEPVVARHHPNETFAAPLVKRASDFDVLLQGNQKFKESIHPGLLEQLTKDGQSPPFMFIGCSDSRVSEGTVFNASPGTLFTERNIANQFHEHDGNTNSVVSYAIDVLGSKHVVVMGHYGCGGVAAAIATPPEGLLDASSAAVQDWVSPIRELFATSTRPEIVALRGANKNKTVVEEPDIREPGFRALVEENVKANVARVAAGSAVKNHLLRAAEAKKVAARAEGGASQDIFVHGLVYDIENGNIVDLKVSVGPAGVPIPEIPFPGVSSGNAGAPVIALEVTPLENASGQTQVAEAEKRAACESSCKGKRSFFKW